MFWHNLPYRYVVCVLPISIVTFNICHSFWCFVAFVCYFFFFVRSFLFAVHVRAALYPIRRRILTRSKSKTQMTHERQDTASREWTHKIILLVLRRYTATKLPIYIYITYSWHGMDRARCSQYIHTPATPTYSSRQDTNKLSYQQTDMSNVWNSKS